jgi:hypothetical protein
LSINSINQVPDSDPRALCHVSGCSPNNWGVLSNGQDVREVLGIYPLSEADTLAARAYQTNRFNFNFNNEEQKGAL